MWQRPFNVADVAGLEIHGTRASASGEDGHTAFAGNEVHPFIGIRVPVEFADASRFYRDHGGGDVGGGLEGVRIDDADFAAPRSLGWRRLQSAKSEVL